MPVAHLEPGARVSVELVADSSGNVAAANDLVEIAGETASYPQVSVVENAGAGVAVLERLPEDYDETTTYGAGEVVGETTVRLRHGVDWVPVDGAYTPTAGDQVVSDAGGDIRAYDAAGGDTADMLLGRVWLTNAAGTEYVSGMAAVIRHR